MKAPVALLPVVIVLFYASATRALSVKSKNEDQLDAGLESRVTQLSEDVNVLSRGINTENLMGINDSEGNGTHDIRKGGDLTKRESNEYSQADSDGEHYREVFPNKGAGTLDSIKNKISGFMKPIVDRIKNKQVIPGQDTSSAIPPPSADSSDSSDSFSTPAPYSSSKCGSDERHRNMETLSLLFPDLTPDKDGQPFAFVPLANALIRVVERELISESRFEDQDSKMKQ